LAGRITGKHYLCPTRPVTIPNLDGCGRCVDNTTMFEGELSATKHH